jgi:glycine oxidase
MAVPRVRYHRYVAEKERIAVVGAGIIGCAVAFELSRRGVDVTVFEGRTVAGGATQASAGILAPYTEAHEGGRLFDLTVRGLAAYDDFVRQVRSTSGAVFEYRRSGTLEIAEDDHRAAELRARLSAPWAASADLRWLQREELRELLPSVNPACVGALQCDSHAHVAVGSFTAAIADAAQQSGARIQLEAAVTRLELASDGIRLGVGDQTATFDRIVLCSGAWTPEIDPLGETAGRIRPVRGQLVRLSSPTQQLRHVVWGSACYIVPWEDGMMLVGATSEEAGFDERATVEGVRGLLGAAQALIPDLGSATFVDVRVGLRPGTVDGVPILGPAKDPRVIYAAGHFRNGVLLAPLTARLIADYVFANAIDPAFSAT